MKKCRKCLIDERVPDVSIGSGNLCDYCSGRRGDEWENRFHVSAKRKAVLLKEFEDYLESIRGKHPYDLVLSLSGGKDSAYLLWHLVERKKMRVLCVNVTTPFESKQAYRNIKRLQKHINFELLTIDCGKEFYIRFYDGLLSNPDHIEFIHSVCHICNPFIHGKCLKTAIEHDIPAVVCGAAPGQPWFMFYEIANEYLNQSWMPEYFNTGRYDDHFKAHFWNPGEYSGRQIPRILAPLHVMKYDSKSIRKQLSASHIIPYRDTHPGVTNCSLAYVMLALDIRRNGYNPFVKDFSSNVRRGEVSRAFWRFNFTLLNWLVRLNLFARGKFRLVESVLGKKLSEYIRPL